MSELYPDVPIGRFHAEDDISDHYRRIDLLSAYFLWRCEVIFSDAMAQVEARVSDIMDVPNEHRFTPSPIAGSWGDYAECLSAKRDPDLFFPERGGSIGDAKKVCRKCLVSSDCLEFALQNDEKFGIWGGMTERERRRLRRQRTYGHQLLADF